MHKFINKMFTIKQLKQNANAQSLEIYEEFVSALKVVAKHSPQIYENGRVNHYWVQTIISILSNGQIIEGGQGNSHPDLYFGKKRIEVKGFTGKEFLNNSPIRVSASKFFASNGGITEIKKLGKDIEKINALIVNESYTDDYYMLTETCGMSTDKPVEDIKIIFISTGLLIDNLIKTSGNHCFQTELGEPKSKKINYGYTHVNLENLKSCLEVTV